MRINEIINEGLLFNEFTFGFELEGYYRIPGHRPDDEHRWFNSPKPNEVHPKRQEIYNNLGNIMKQYFPNNGKFVKDESLREKLGYFDFEWASPILNFNPQTIKRVIDFLNSMPDHGIKTTSDCGFHVHVSFPYMNNLDRVWLICNLAIDPIMRKKLEKFKKFKFLHDDYAGTMILEQLAKELEIPVTDEEDAQKLFGLIKNIISDEKFELVRLHPQGTLEWRGPRNFLNKPDQTVIKEFFIRLREFIQWIKVTMDKKEIVGIDKKTFLSNVGSARLNKPITQDRLVSIYRKLEKNPDLLNKLHNVDILNHLQNNKETSPYFDDLFKGIVLTPETQMFYAKNKMIDLLFDKVETIDEGVWNYLLDTDLKMVIYHTRLDFMNSKTSEIEYNHKKHLWDAFYDKICSVIKSGNFDILRVFMNFWYVIPLSFIEALHNHGVWDDIPGQIKKDIILFRNE